MFFPDVFINTNTLLNPLLVSDLLSTNIDSQEYGLVLSENEAKELIESRNTILTSYGRVELDMEVPKKIIQQFCSSPYINQQDYISTLHDLIEIFYYIKNETEDALSDDDLIDLMYTLFNDTCMGSLDLLQGTKLEAIADQIRRENQMSDFLKGEDIFWTYMISKII